MCIKAYPIPSPALSQVGALTAREIPACFLGSAQANASIKEDAWRGGRYLVVYMTPESALGNLGRLKELNAAVPGGLSLVAVDEVG